MEDPDAARLGRQRGFNGINWTRWDNLSYVLLILAQLFFHWKQQCSLPIMFFNEGHEEKSFNTLTDLATFIKRIAPKGHSNLFGALEATFLQHLVVGKPLIVFVLSDGEPSEGQLPLIKQLVDETVVAIDPSAQLVKIVFLRVGDRPEAIQFFDKLKCPNIVAKSDNFVFKIGAENFIQNIIYRNWEGYG